MALDLLAFHTTRLGTAEQRTLSELHATCPDQKATIQSLVQNCRDLYLLADPAENRPGQELTTRLAHDTLAPLAPSSAPASTNPTAPANAPAASLKAAPSIGPTPKKGPHSTNPILPSSKPAA